MLHHPVATSIHHFTFLFFVFCIVIDRVIVEFVGWQVYFSPVTYIDNTGTNPNKYQSRTDTSPAPPRV